jgi:superfamily II DNA or RNA helicase
MHVLPGAGEAPTTGSPIPSDFESIVEAAANGEASAAERALLEAHPVEWRETLEDLLDDTEASLESVRAIKGPERAQVVADFEEEKVRLVLALAALTGTEPGSDAALAIEVPGDVRLQSSWADGRVVVWAGGPGTNPATAEELSELLDRAGAPPASSWVKHGPVTVPTGNGAPTLAIPVGDALGWLVAAGADAGQGTDLLGSSIRWLGRVAVWGVRLVAQGSIVPTLRAHSRRENGPSSYSVRWAPALVDRDELRTVAAAMPGTVGAVNPSVEGRVVALAVLGAVVDAIATKAAAQLDFAAPPPDPRNLSSTAEAFLTRLDGSRFEAPTRAGTELAKRLERWAKPATDAPAGRLVVQLDPPDKGDAWYLSVQGPNPDGRLVPVEVAIVDHRALADQLTRLERLLPLLRRPGGKRVGEVVLNQAEAWELMTVTGPTLEAAGFTVRVPALSRRKPSPSLRLSTDPSTPSVVGAHQLTAVSWSALFDDVELSAAEIHRLAAEARPLVRSHGAWVELDKADLAEAAAALAERASVTQLTGAEVLRHAIGLEGAHLAGTVQVHGGGWAADLLAKSADVASDLTTTPPGFEGELRSYQAEALAWLGFLDSVELGGCLALDMGLGKTPTILAHLARNPTEHPALVIAPPAVVGNWAAEAARFAPKLRVVVHHGASRAGADELDDEFRNADVVISTYGTAVRDIDALSARSWDRLVLDEAQAIKNAGNETAQQLRRLNARVRIALTGTPIENGLGDLWAILDFTNPGLVGTRSTFIAQLSAEGEGSRQSAEHALRALNGILVFRRTKSEPAVAAELPERIDQLDHCAMTPEQIGLYQAVLDTLVATTAESSATGDDNQRKGAVLAAITALKQICNHPSAYQDDEEPLAGRSGKLARLEEIVDSVFAANERVLVFTHFAEWGKKLAEHLSDRTGTNVECYHGGLSRGARDRIVADFQNGEGAGALVLSLKAGGTGLNLTAANHVVLYDRWWNPAVEDQARDRAWRIGQTRTVVSHRLVCPGTVDERVEEVVAGKRHIANLVLPASSSLADLDASQLRTALGLGPGALLADESGDVVAASEAAA